MSEETRGGRAAKHIEEVLPFDYVLDELFGFSNPGSLRKFMSRHGVYMVKGYRYEDVKKAFQDWDPDKSWDRRPKEADEH